MLLCMTAAQKRKMLVEVVERQICFVKMREEARGTTLSGKRHCLQMADDHCAQLAEEEVRA